MTTEQAAEIIKMLTAIKFTTGLVCVWLILIAFIIISCWMNRHRD